MKKKLIILCLAVGLSLTPATTSFAAMTLNLDADSLAAGVYTSGSPLIIPTPYGNVEFVGEILDLSTLTTLGKDVDFVAAGASGNVFDVPYPSRTASLTFNFRSVLTVTDATFIYGGNQDSIVVEALDSSAGVLDSLSAPTANGDPAGPVTLYAGTGNSIYSLSWRDPQNGGPFQYDYAALDNISLTIIPAPGAILLGSIGVGIVGWLRRKRTL